MPDISNLLAIAKSAAVEAGGLLSRAGLDRFSYSKELPKEVKSLADEVLDQAILSVLSKTGFGILSEESGYIPGSQPGGHRFIVDPLDGTFNFLKNLGPCAVSIAFWDANKPVFGVVFDIAKKSLFWGGAELGAWRDGDEIRVSDTCKVSEASICTGFPVRFDLSAGNALKAFQERVSEFSKVRMLGSAASSLACVADGRADAYFEEDIMLWDVAAGIAIVEGAGGRVHWESKLGRPGLHVYADNGCLGGHL